MLAYAALSFLGAFLLFLIQPLMARAVLPWFGGAASVWTTSLLFYQALLFVGYGYAHAGRRLGPRGQAVVHLLLFAATLALLPVSGSEVWRPTGAELPAPRLLGLLAASVGGPYLLLAGTTPLLHGWFAPLHPQRSPYPLYAASNAGSLAALLSYPFVLEPLVGVSHQAVAWSVGYALFALALLRIAWPVVRGASAEGRSSVSIPAATPPPGTTPPGSAASEPTGAVEAEPEPEAANASGAGPHPEDVVRWLALTACGSGLLLAVTNAITLDVSPVPLLWILPLATYLASFVLAFAGAYRRATWGALLVLALPAAALLWAGGFALPVLVQVGLGLGVLFVGCMVCHGELVRSAPPPAGLTLFYLTIAAGGALGGLAVAILAPAVLSDFYELPFFVLLSYALLLMALRRTPGDVLSERARRMAWAVLVGIGVAAALAFVVPTLRRNEGTVAAVRGFYGVLRVQDDPPGMMNGMRVLRHGRIFHGAAFLDRTRRHEPTAYFTEGSGVALAIREHAKRESGAPMRIGVVGLGVGTLAAWGHTGDSIRFYELDPDAERLAHRYFPFLSSSAADVEVVLGDGRLSLERDLGAGGGPLYDVLVVDAFAGDAVPMHLLTREAGELYRRAVGPEGIIVFQITNRHVDLERVVRGLALSQGLRGVRVDRTPARGSGGVPNSWMLLGAEGVRLPEGRASPPPGPERLPVVWTDDHANLLSVLR